MVTTVIQINASARLKATEVSADSRLWSKDNTEPQEFELHLNNAEKQALQEMAQGKSPKQPELVALIKSKMHKFMPKFVKDPKALSPDSLKKLLTQMKR